MATTMFSCLLLLFLGHAGAVDCGCTGTNTMTYTQTFYVDNDCVTKQTKYADVEPERYDSSSKGCFADYGCKCSGLEKYLLGTNLDGFGCNKKNNPDYPDIKSILSKCYSTVDGDGTSNVDVDGAGPTRPCTLALALFVLVAIALVPGAEAVDCGCTGTNTITGVQTGYTDNECSTGQTQYTPERYDSTSTECYANFECKCSKFAEYMRGTSTEFKGLNVCTRVNNPKYPEIKSLLYKCYSTVDGDGTDKDDKSEDNNDDGKTNNNPQQEMTKANTAPSVGRVCVTAVVCFLLSLVVFE